MTNPPAFPLPEGYLHPYMTLLDYFAGQALTGLISEMGPLPANEKDWLFIVEDSYELAAAMLEERLKYLKP